MIISYDAAINTGDKWTSVKITAEAERLSEYRVVVQKVISIESKSRKYSVESFANQQLGLTKNLASCVEVVL